jgi:hypothetical protein
MENAIRNLDIELFGQSSDCRETMAADLFGKLTASQVREIGSHGLTSTVLTMSTADVERIWSDHPVALWDILTEMAQGLDYESIRAMAEDGATVASEDDFRREAVRWALDGLARQLSFGSPLADAEDAP